MRITHLDGLRGIAAIIVVFSHIMAGFMPALYFGSRVISAPQWQYSFAVSPLFVAINGSFAVYVFFVLSGFVIAGSADATRASILASCLGRVVRLSVPCSVSVLLASFLIFTQVTWIKHAADIVDFEWIQAYTMEVPLRRVLFEVLGGYYWSGSSRLNPVLWTMQRELLGSLSIYIIYGLLQNRMQRLWICITIALVLSLFKIETQFYLCFVAGCVLFEMRGWIAGLPSWLGMSALCVGIVFGGRPFAVPTPGSFYYLSYVVSPRFYAYMWPLGAALIVTGTLLSTTAMKLLGGEIGKFLGRISFSVYLIHLILLESLFSYLFVAFGHLGSIEFGVSVLIYIFTVVVVGFAFTIVVDEPATRLSHYMRRRFVIFRARLIQG